MIALFDILVDMLMFFFAVVGIWFFVGLLWALIKSFRNNGGD